MYATFSSPKKNDGFDIVNHASVALNTITLVLFVFTKKTLSIQNTFKAFRYLYSPSGCHRSTYYPQDIVMDICTR